MDPETILLWVERIGIAPAILVLLIVLIFKITKIHSTVKSNTAKDNTFTTADSIRDRSEKDSTIRKIMKGLLTEHKAVRVRVYLFHNGGHSVSGIKFLRMTCTHEIVSPGTKSLAQWYQGLSVSMLPSVMRRISNTEFLCVDDINSFRDSNEDELYYNLKDEGVKSLCGYGLYDTTHLPIGFLTVNFDRKQTMDLGLQCAIQESCAKISGVLETMAS